MPWDPINGMKAACRPEGGRAPAGLAPVNAKCRRLSAKLVARDQPKQGRLATPSSGCALRLWAAIVFQLGACAMAVGNGTEVGLESSVALSLLGA